MAYPADEAPGEFPFPDQGECDRDDPVLAGRQLTFTSCSSRARLNNPVIASLSCSVVASTIGRRASIIISHPGWICSSCGFIAARIWRLARLRFTAFPIERLAAIPHRKPLVSFGNTINTTSGWAKDFPNRRTRWKSVDLVRRNLRFTRTSQDCIQVFDAPAPVRLAFDRLTLPVNFLDVIIHAHGQALTSFGTAGF
jgi:hypothetical protein